MGVAASSMVVSGEREVFSQALLTTFCGAEVKSTRRGLAVAVSPEANPSPTLPISFTLRVLIHGYPQIEEPGFFYPAAAHHP